MKRIKRLVLGQEGLFKKGGRGMEKKWLKVGASFLAGLGVLALVFSAEAALSNLKVVTRDNMGNETSGVNVTITPDWNGNNDFATIEFDSDIQQSSEFRAKIDIEGDGFGSEDDVDMWYFGTGHASFWWEGRDKNWKTVANGTYQVQVTDGITTDSTTLSVTVLTASIQGTVRNSADNSPIEGAEIEAHGPYGWGNAITGSNGEYTIAGLQSGQGVYYDMVEVRRAEGFVSTFYDPDNMNGPDRVEMTETVVTGIDFLLTPAEPLSGILSLSSSFNQFTNEWGGIEDRVFVHVEAWQPAGNKNGRGDFHIHAADWMGWTDDMTDTDWDGMEDSVATRDAEGTATAESATSAAYTIYLEAGATTYNLRAESEGFTSREYTSITIAADTDNTLNISLQKAGSISGYVYLPEATTYSMWINTEARETTTGERYWGGGNIDPFNQDSEGGTRGSFRFRSVTNGTYDITLRVEGNDPDTGMWSQPYAPVTIEGVVMDLAQDPDVVLDNVTMSTGAEVTGTITVLGDTTGDFIMGQSPDYDANPTTNDNDPNTPEDREYRVWINAWSPDNDNWNGRDVFIPRGVDQQAQYTISGLQAGTYEVNLWIEGYEISEPEGYPPYNVTISEDAAGTLNFVFTRPSGTISGNVSAEGQSINYNNVRVILESSGWENYQPPRATSVDGSGNFEFTGLPTSEYRVKANQYTSESIQQFDQASQGGWTPPVDMLQPDGTFGTAQENVGLAGAGDASLSQKTVNLVLSEGGSISGTVTVSTASGETYTIAQMAQMGMRITAFDMSNMMMGGGQPTIYSDNIDESGNYTIEGLSRGVYSVVPDNMFDWSNDAQFGDQAGTEGGFWTPKPDIAVSSTTVLVDPADTDEKDITDIDFEVQRGYTVSGTLTLPTSPNNEWEWLADLGLDQAEKNGWGQHQSVQGWHFLKDNAQRDENWQYGEEDFNRFMNFTIEHVMPGEFILRAYSDRFLVDWREVNLSEGDVTGISFNMSEGANIVGTLVNAKTGEKATSDDGVRIMCEARPWVEGSWRETRDDNWSPSYIEDGESDYRDDGESPNDTAGKFHLTNLPAGKYILNIQADTGYKTQGAKNYANVIIAGVEIPDGTEAGTDIDIGTIQLNEGVTITGKVLGDDGLPAVSVTMSAMPADSHLDWWSSATGETQTDGTYTIYGIDPSVPYYDVTAADRPEWDNFTVVVWGEDTRENVPVTEAGASGIDFVLIAADAGLEGTITKPAGSPEFSLPDWGDVALPSCFLLLQEQGQVYDDPLDGIEFMSESSNSDTTTFSIDGIVPGTYTLKVFSSGFAMGEVRDIVLTAGQTVSLDDTVGAIELLTGGTVQGTLLKEDGNKAIYGVDIEEVVAITEDMSTLNFGTLLYNSQSDEIDRYEVKGLLEGVAYRIVFVSPFDEGDEVFIMPDTVTVTDTDSDGTVTDETVTADQVLGTFAPEFLAFIERNDEGTSALGDDTFDISVYSTTYLSESTADLEEGNVVTTTGSGTLTVSGVGYGFSTDKREIDINYDPQDDGTAITEDSFTIVVTGHNNEGTEGTSSFTFATGVDNANMLQIGIAGGSASLGGGDATGLYLPPGSLNDADLSGGTEVTITGTGSTTSAKGLGRTPTLSKGIVRGYTMAGVSRSPALPTGAASKLYDFSLSGSDTIGTGRTATVTLEYNTSYSGDPEDLNVFHYNEDTGYWEVEETSKKVKSTNGNHSVAVSVDGLSPFVLLEDDAPSAPAGLTVTAGDAQLVLTWDAVSGASGYNVYRSATSGGDYTLINDTEVTTTTYTDTGLTNGTPYYYVVTAVTDIGNSQKATSSDSDEANGTPEAADDGGGDGDTGSSGGGGGGCFVATAAYGSPLAQEVVALSNFRDEYLLTNDAGRRFVAFYYKKGPEVADFVAKDERLKEIVRIALKPLVWLSEKITH